MIRSGFINLIIVFATALCLPLQSLAVSRALVIGLGEQQDASWSKINGDNDIPYVVNLLQKSGYSDIRTLKNKQATKAGILKAFSILKESCKPGDKVYIHYSGHGQLVTDLNGDESLRWNGWHAEWDQSLVPYDAYMIYCDKDRGEKHLTDDELAVLLTGIRSKVGVKGEIIVVIDACHSGDATCGAIDEPIRGVDMKFNIPRQPGLKPTNPIKERWLTISACQPYQLCTEIKDKKVGKLTYALYSLGPSFFKYDNKKLASLLETFLKKYEGRLPQTPMISGKK